MKDLNIRYDNNDKLYQLNWTGSTKTKDVKLVFLQLMRSYHLRGEGYLLLIDNSEAHYEEPISSCLKIAQFCNETPAVFAQSKVAVVTKRPHATALLFYIEKHLANTQMKVFSSLNAAKQWLIE